jgi:hypothetical protein
MSEWVDIPLAVTQGEDGSTYVSDAELSNLMLKRNPPGARRPFHVANTPCIKMPVVDFTAVGSGAIRGMCHSLDGTDKLWVIRGTGIHYLLAGAWTTVPVGTMPGTGPCRMVDADTHIVAVDGTNARAITTSESFACSRANFSDVTYQDGITLYTETGTNSLYASNVDDPITINALNFTTVDALAGSLVGVISDHREVYAFKTDSIEHYYNTGGSGFPFTRSSPGLIETGVLLLGVLTIVKLNNTIFWLGNDRRVYSMHGNRPTPISTPWVEKYLETATAQGVTIYGSAFLHDGVQYYCLSGFNNTAGTAKEALVCNLETGLWHRWGSSLVASGGYTGVLIVSVVGLPAVGAGLASVGVYLGANSASNKGIVYLVDAGTFTDAGDTTAHSPTSAVPTRTMTVPQVDYGGVRAFMPEIYLDMQKTSASGTCSLQVSDDGGSSYSTAVSGTATNPRTRWHRLGSFFQRILRFTFVINSRMAIMGVRARIDVGE